MPVRPMPDPEVGAVFLDPRGGGRALRVTWHVDRPDADEGLVVLSLWRDNVCVGSFRLGPEQVPGLIALLAHGLDESQARHGRPAPDHGGHAADGPGHAAAG